MSQAFRCKRLFGSLVLAGLWFLHFLDMLWFAGVGVLLVLAFSSFFFASWGKNHAKTSPEAAFDAKLAPRACWKALGIVFGVSGNLFGSQLLLNATTTTATTAYYYCNDDDYLIVLLPRMQLRLTTT